LFVSHSFLLLLYCGVLRPLTLICVATCGATQREEVSLPLLQGVSPRLAFEYSSIIALEYPQALERDREIVRLFLNLVGYAVIPLLFKTLKNLISIERLKSQI